MSDISVIPAHFPDANIPQQLIFIPCDDYTRLDIIQNYKDLKQEDSNELWDKYRIDTSKFIHVAPSKLDIEAIKDEALMYKLTQYLFEEELLNQTQLMSRRRIWRNKYRPNTRTTTAGRKSLTNLKKRQNEQREKAKANLRAKFESIKTKHAKVLIAIEENAKEKQRLVEKKQRLEEEARELQEEIRSASPAKKRQRTEEEQEGGGVDQGELDF